MLLKSGENLSPLYSIHKKVKVITINFIAGQVIFKQPALVCYYRLVLVF